MDHLGIVKNKVDGALWGHGFHVSPLDVMRLICSRLDNQNYAVIITHSIRVERENSNEEAISGWDFSLRQHPNIILLFILSLKCQSLNK